VRKLLLVGAALLAVGVVHPGQAVVLFSDGFNYPDGALISVSGGAWVHHSGATGEVRVVSGRVLLSQTNSEDVSAQLAGQPYAPTTNIQLYASFTVRFTALPSGNGEYFAHFKASGTSGFNDKLFATTNGAPVGSIRIGVANGANSANVFLSGSFSLNTDYLLVTRYSVSNASSTLWLNPSAETDTSVTAQDIASLTNTITAFALRESLSNGSGMGTLSLDNLAIGTSFSDVVSNASAGPPIITAEPQSQTVVEGSTASFMVQATGATPLFYQWQFNGSSMVGATDATLTLAGASAAQAGQYTVAITNAIGTTNSLAARLTVIWPPTITVQPQSQIVGVGANVTFSVSASGAAPLAYQWLLHGTNLAGATHATLVLNGVTTNQAGPYVVTVSNADGVTNSQPAILTVNPASGALTVLTYNVKGNGVTNWSIDLPQVQALGREVMYLQPDIITFNEIPYNQTWQIPSFVGAYLPGYYWATNSGTDGFIRSVILSRFPIVFSQKWLDGAGLAAFGYSGNFTRDLFQAQIAVSGFAQPLDVFVTHLKATTSSPQDDANKRAAEASAVSNFFATVYLPGTNALHPYLLNGDLNEDVFRPETNKYSSGQPIQRLVSTPTGLQLTTPVNPITGSDLTESIQTSLNVRFDYILPGGLLASNIVSSQVFRTDLLTNPPPPLLANDDRTASDHLPVRMVFSNPYDQPFQLTSITWSNQTTTLQWQSVRGQSYRVDASSGLTGWSALANNLTATGPNFTFATNLPTPQNFFRIHRGP
jgi:endonuclease/exonuclease/phosphatase family metal-dependent hydrolase